MPDIAVIKANKDDIDRSQHGPFIVLALCIALTAFLASNRPDFPELWMLRVLFVPSLVFSSVHSLYYIFRIHEKYGFFKVQEPEYHFWFAMKTIWVVLLWGIGQVMLLCILGCSGRASPTGYLLWELPEKYIFLHASNPMQEVMIGVIGFYLTDFCRYWGHRVGHWGIFFKTFPFSHFLHHNQVFLTPFVTLVSPLVHLAAWASFIPLVFLYSQRLGRVAFAIDIAMNFTNVTMHLGCDPLPWLTKWNHLYCFGAIPWIPLYHQYHHIPFLAAANFGNSSMLWDYVFGTLCPESIEHISTGRMPIKVSEKMQAAGLEDMMRMKLKNRARLDLNDDSSGSLFNFALFN